MSVSVEPSLERCQVTCCYLECKPMRAKLTSSGFNACLTLLWMSLSCSGMVSHLIVPLGAIPCGILPSSCWAAPGVIYFIILIMFGLQRACLRTVQEVAKGMEYIHSFDIVHGDLKPGTRRFHRNPSCLLASSRETLAVLLPGCSTHPHTCSAGNVLLKTHRIDRRGYIAKVSDFGESLR